MVRFVYTGLLIHVHKANYFLTKYMRDSAKTLFGKRKVYKFQLFSAIRDRVLPRLGLSD